jgi:putative chitobiose transport system substrate-binding protein
MGKVELDVNALIVSSRSANRRLAGEFVEWVTNRENELRFCKLVPIFPSIRTALDDPFFRTEDSTLESRARCIGAVQIRSAEVLKPSLKEYQRLNTIFKDQMMRAFLGRASVSEALDAAAAQWDKFLAEEE